jgi:hypothetical protein
LINPSKVISLSESSILRHEQYSDVMISRYGH